MFRVAQVSEEERVPLKDDAPKRRRAECCNWEWTTQTRTFVLSLVVQLLVLLFSWVALGRGSPPEVLRVILTLEAIIQAVELVWYAGIALRFLRGYNTGVWARYLDWAVTTPTMLITFFFLAIYFHKPCITTDELTNYPRFAGYIALIVLCDWAMLLLGFLYEFNAFNLQASAWGRWPLFAGFVPLLLAFIPHFDILTAHPTWEAFVIILVNLLVWSVYGVVSVAWFGDKNAEHKNSAFNILDLFSKNAAGLVVSIIALNFDPDTCVLPPSSPPVA